MRLAVFAFTRRGCEAALEIRQILQPRECRLITMAKFEQPEFESYVPPLAEYTKPIFRWADILIFVGSAGVAVRAVAPWVKDKKTDPAVLVVDEGKQFVISLLSGHIGGANEAARHLAEELRAIPVITTATDVNSRFSVDTWASRQGLTISSMKAAKAVSAAILEEDVPLVCDFPIRGTLPSGVVPGETGKVGIYVGYRNKQPFAVTLRLIPRVLRLGIGCRKGISEEAIARAVTAVCQREGIAEEAICAVGSIDLKAEEPGLLAYCRHKKLPVKFYTAEELRRVPGEFPASGFVSSVTGVDNVCQRAAMLGAQTCIAEKTAMDGVTVALAEINWEAVF